MWDRIVSVPDHCLSFYSSNDEYPIGTVYCVFFFFFLFSFFFFFFISSHR